MLSQARKYLCVIEPTCNIKGASESLRCYNGTSRWRLKRNIFVITEVAYFLYTSYKVVNCTTIIIDEEGREAGIYHHLDSITLLQSIGHQNDVSSMTVRAIDSSGM